MIIPLSHIGPAGLRRPVQMALNHFPRLAEMLGPQTEMLQGEVLLKNRSGHVEVTGTLQAKVRVTCHRCLDPVLVEIEEPVQVTLVPETQAAQSGETELAAEDLDVSFYSGDAIDLTVVLEDEMILMIPEPACEESDEGICTCCGRAVAEVLNSDAMQQRAAPDEAFHPLAGLRSLIRKPDGNKR